MSTPAPKVPTLDSLNIPKSSLLKTTVEGGKLKIELTSPIAMAVERQLHKVLVALEEAIQSKAASKVRIYTPEGGWATDTIRILSEAGVKHKQETELEYTKGIQKIWKDVSTFYIPSSST